MSEKKFVQRASPENKIPAQAVSEKKIRASGKFPTPPGSLFLMVRPLSLLSLPSSSLSSLSSLLSLSSLSYCQMKDDHRTYILLQLRKESLKNNPVQAFFFFRRSFRNCKSCVSNCNVHPSFNSSLRSSHI